MKRLVRFQLFLVIAGAAVLATTHGCNAGHSQGTAANKGGSNSDNFSFGQDDAGPPLDLASAPSCLGIACQIEDCGEQPPTTLTGTVFAPNGTLPIYNAIVYIPNAKIEPFKDMPVSCDRCNGQVSGSPLVLAQTGPDGKFTLANVPAGQSVPLVIQIGKWRRQVTIPTVPKCTTTTLDAALTSLPKNKKEGDIPRIAIATGSSDPLECLLLKIGIDPNEIKEPGHATRVEFYKAAHSPGTTISPMTPSAADPMGGLYTGAKRLHGYDIVMLPCEGSEYDQAANAGTIADYVNEGGRVFATHYSYAWLTYPNSPFNKIANPLKAGLWPKGQMDTGFGVGPIVAKLVLNFPKGKAFAKWLVAAGALSAPNTLNIEQIRHDIDGVVPSYAQAWATDTFKGVDANGQPTMVPGTAELTFNTPLDAERDDGGVPQYCGRVVYSDFHVAQSEANPGVPFPGTCMMGKMSDQEMALAFMLFDLSSCIQSDETPPIF